jgi:hypothetical protein
VKCTVAPVAAFLTGAVVAVGGWLVLGAVVLLALPLFLSPDMHAPPSSTTSAAAIAADRLTSAPQCACL